MSLSRREALAMLGATPLLGTLARAQDSPLPLHTTGLEHIGFTVPEPEVSAKFYGRIFDPQLFQERDAPPRFYAKIGTAYIAFGGNANSTPKIDHICALVENYKAADVRKALADAGIVMGTTPLSMPTDGDGLRLQLLGVPGGLAKTIIPNTRISQEDAAIQAIGLDHITLLVTDLEKSTPFYRTFFGKEASRTKSPSRVSFAAAHTKLVLEQAPAGQPAKVDHFCVRIAGFDRSSVSEKLKKLGAEILPSTDEKLLRFKDLNGFVVELKGPA